MIERPNDSSRAWATGAVLFASLWWLLDVAVLRAGTPHPLDDVWEYAVAARALLEGHGFRTPMIHPPLWALRDAAMTVPILVHGPLVPVLMMPFVLAFGALAPDAAAFLAAVAAALAAAATFRLGARHFGAPVGAAAAVLFTLSPLVVRAVNHDMALPVGALLLVAGLDLALRPRPRAFASGVAMGLAYLVRPEMLLAAPLVAVATGAGAWRLTAGFALVAAPWWAHLWIATGQPLFNLSSYLLIGYWHRAELSPMRDFSLTPDVWPAVLRTSLPELPAKWLDLFPHAMKRALLAPSGATGWLAALGGLLAIAPLPTRTLGVLALALAAIPVAVQCATLYDSRYLVPFLPLWTLAAAFAAERIAARMPAWSRGPRAWIGVLLLLALPSALPALRGGAREAAELRARLALERAALATHATPAAAAAARPLMFSDTPDFVAWTTHRAVVWLTPAEWRALPAAGDANRLGLPRRGEPGDTWFEGDTLSSDEP